MAVHHWALWIRSPRATDRIGITGWISTVMAPGAMEAAVMPVATAAAMVAEEMAAAVTDTRTGLARKDDRSKCQHRG